MERVVVLEQLSQVLEAEDRLPTPVQLPASGKWADVATVLRSEAEWLGDVPANYGTVPNKPKLAFQGQVLYPEFILLRLLEQAGWTGTWVKNWRGRAFWRNIDEEVVVPPSQEQLFKSIERSTDNARGGCWDIFAWREDATLFVESKARGNDSIRDSQALWLERGLEYGLPLPSFLIVEYVRPDKPRPSRRKPV